ncbi:hypothetical protein V12B01_13530 [Vibrio splendidus 12B01]|nr:hypothetical protein V12B01_13530 [Vibrio splendidus 12B01]
MVCSFCSCPLCNACCDCSRSPIAVLFNSTPVFTVCVIISCTLPTNTLKADEI